MRTYIAAIDQGTTSSRCILFDKNGDIYASDQIEHKQIFPRPGWVEHNATEILQNTLRVLRGALEKGGVQAQDIEAIGITNQRETIVVWDKQTGEPLHNAIVWQDTRTDEICSDLGKVYGQNRFREKTGLPLATYFSGPKLMWLLQQDEGIRQKAQSGQALFGNIDTWLIWNLTGGPQGGKHISDVTNASRTLMMNLKTLDWDEEILKVLGIPRAMLPEIKPSSAVLGKTTVLGQPIPIAGDLGDQQAALFGQTCFQPGEAKNTYGTGCFLLLNTGTQPMESPNGLLTTVGYKIGEQDTVYALEGSIAFAGALVQWVRDNLKLIERSPDIEKLAATVEDNGGIYFVPAFSGLFAPHWRSDARGVIVGITSYINAGHIARAVLEATAYQTKEVLNAMEKDSGVHLTALKVDGGMVANELLMQFQSDILDVPVMRPKVAETTALGAAYAAGLAVGYWSGQDTLLANWKLEKQWQPVMDEQRRTALYAGWMKAVQRTLNWVD